LLNIFFIEESYRFLYFANKIDLSIKLKFLNISSAMTR
jgi:hypothetical protein